MRTFLKNVFKQSMVLFFSMLLATFLFYAITLLILASLGNNFRTEVPASAVLVLDMGVEVPDAPIDTGMIGPFLREGSLSFRFPLRTLIRSIDKAAADPRIKALLLRGDGPDMPDTGLSSIAEIRDAVARFKKSGKPVYAWLEDAGMRDYALASVADHVWMHPLCSLGLEGFAAERLYFGEAFSRYGIGVQTASAGGYKSAPDSFALEHMSAKDREQLEAFLADVWSSYAGEIAASRNISEQALKDLSGTKGLLNAEEAVQAGLVDRVAYEDELVGELAGIAGDDGSDCGYSSFDMADYAAFLAEDQREDQRGAVIAIVYVEGEIVDGEGSWDEAGSDRIVDQLRDLRSDDNVKGVVLRVNSPGGSAIASEKIRREVELLRNECPVVVSMGRMAASGGYWISAPADKIYVEPTTLTGSIGVFSLFIDVEKLAGNLGVNSDRVVTAPFADMYSAFSQRDPKEMALARKMVDGIYDEFLEIVAEGRGMDKALVADLAQGRIWSGAAALDNGLADAQGGLAEAVAETAVMASLGDAYQVEELPVGIGMREQIRGILRSSASAAQPWPMSGVSKEMERFARIGGMKGVLARMPFFTSARW